MPDKSPAKTETSSEPDELFATEVTEKSRVRRRSLKATTPSPARSPVDSGAAGSDIVAPNPKDELNAAARLTEPATTSATRPTFASTVSPSASSKAPFRPVATEAPATGTLYYSTGSNPEKEKQTPMKTTSPTTSSASAPVSGARSATPGAASAPTRAAAPSTVVTSVSRPAATGAATRPTSAVDYRANIDRQAKEQKSMGGVLAILVYSLIGLFVIGAGLAGFGAYALSKQIRQQSLTIDELDKHYSEQNQILTTQLKATTDDLAQAQSQIGKQQQVIQQQQQALTRVTAIAEQLASNLQTERQTRAGETAALRSKIRSIENWEPASH